MAGITLMSRQYRCGTPPWSCSSQMPCLLCSQARVSVLAAVTGGLGPVAHVLPCLQGCVWSWGSLAVQAMGPRIAAQGRLGWRHVLP